MADDIRRRVRNLLFIDIETVAGVGSYEDLSDRMKNLWDKKASKIPQSTPEPLTNAELFYDRAAIYAEFGKIVCIAFGAIYWDEENEMAVRVRSFSGKDEGELLREFRELLGKYSEGPILCAHNGKEFDFPYLCRRMIIHGIELPPILQMTGKKPWEILHQDTMEMWKYGDYKSYTSLDLLAAVFDIPGSKGEMDGSQVTPVYYEEEGGLEKISRYCREDVVVLAQLYLRLQNYPLVVEKNIFRIE